MLVDLAICVLVCFIVWSIQNPRNGIPELSGRLPIIGHCLIFWGDSRHVLKTFKRVGEEALSKNGAIAIDFGPIRAYAIADPDDCAIVTAHCLDKPFFYDLGIPYLGNSLIVSKEHIWKQQRKALNPAFSLQSLYNFMDIFNNQGRRLIWQLGSHGPGPFDHYHTILTNSAETSLQTITSYSLDEVIDKSEIFIHNFELLLKLVTARFSQIWLWNDYLFNLSDLKKQHDKCVEILHGICQQAIIKKRLQKKINFTPQKNEERQSMGNITLLDYILDQDKSNTFTNDEQLREQLDIFLAASYDTTASTLTYVFTVIGSYPEVQQKIYDEIKAVVGDNNDVTKDDVPRLVYLEAVIKETMRLYPTASVVARYTNVDIHVKNGTIPKGSSIIIIILALNRHPIWGPDADQFKPERWLNPNSLPNNLNCFASFSLGKRNCIGKTYAMMSMKVSLVHVLRRYKVTGDISNTKHRLDVLMKPASGHYIIFEERSNIFL